MNSEEIYVWKVFYKLDGKLYSAFAKNYQSSQQYVVGINFPKIHKSSIFCCDTLKTAKAYLSGFGNESCIVKKVKGIKSKNQPKIICGFGRYFKEFWNFVNSSDGLGFDNFYSLPTPKGTIFMDYIIIEE